MGSILPRARKPCHSGRASPPPSCHSERSEESWLGLNPAETNETRRKTPRRPPCPSERSETAPSLHPSALHSVIPSEAKPLPLCSLPLPILSFRAQRGILARS